MTTKSVILVQLYEWDYGGKVLAEFVAHTSEWRKAEQATVTLAEQMMATLEPKDYGFHTTLLPQSPWFQRGVSERYARVNQRGRRSTEWRLKLVTMVEGLG